MHSHFRVHLSHTFLAALLYLSRVVIAREPTDVAEASNNGSTTRFATPSEVKLEKPNGVFICPFPVPLHRSQDDQLYDTSPLDADGYSEDGSEHGSQSAGDQSLELAGSDTLPSEFDPPADYINEKPFNTPSLEWPRPYGPSMYPTLWTLCSHRSSLPNLGCRCVWPGVSTDIICEDPPGNRVQYDSELLDYCLNSCWCLVTPQRDPPPRPGEEVQIAVEAGPRSRDHRPRKKEIPQRRLYPLTDVGMGMAGVSWPITPDIFTKVSITVPKSGQLVPGRRRREGATQAQTMGKECRAGRRAELCLPAWENSRL